MAAPAANGAKVDGVKVISAMPDLHLMSWNVAGWKTTSEHIRRFKGGLAAFLERHHVDVLCLQEVKLSAKVLASDALKLGADIPGFESFWACNEGQGAQRQGLNGVATFVRQGLVVRADSQPLNDSELDSEGRCLMTDHGTFVVFNVYVPNSAGGMRLPFKMRFQVHLRAAMAGARKAGKAVILAGDLNMKARAVDSHWMMRPLEVPRLRGLVARGPEAHGPAISADASVAVDAISASWPSVAAALRAKQHRPFETKNSRTGQTFQRWGVYAKARSGEVVRIGPPHDVEDWARASFLVDGVAIERDCEVVLGAGYADATFLLQRPGVLSAADLGECMKKLEGVEVGPAALKSISDAFGDVGTPPAVKDWLQSVLHEDGMVDSFTAFYPHAEERFTCWDQYKNKRHENMGSRIDYILVDKAFFECHARQGAGLDSRGREPDSPLAALAAATFDGLSQPSSFAGGGMPPLHEDEFFAQFREKPATGIVYTPQQLSDHIAVSLLLSPSDCRLVAPPATLVRDAATQLCQPHRSARRITDFFMKRPAPAAAAPLLAKRAALGVA
eukprot:CAMPEP_0177317982 /NCGR_PEP_ID=MMETSP0368-20130122/13829_1 /TAXON_ID=447022 ORGANISM="Scrippsiella hangoei-like, Strain SHHI-4" /NCGR_SAMPLE_ID=MMETSP0368 /ASSEMBLY_ACC=CAM_ASM_000363 /LENGTH=559 /DNA_ID=CAMNT_0018777377 /DNA_START=66 /DNA_END=1746 /DNA_ORIENTATION=+